MLLVSVEILPQGNPKEKRQLGRIEIWNDETGNEALGNYIAQYVPPEGSTRRVRMEKQPRSIVGAHFALIAEAIRLLFPMEAA